LRAAHELKAAGMYRSHAASFARIHVNHSNPSRTAPLRWSVHFDDQFVLDP
jgi:hypothetical protein